MPRGTHRYYEQLDPRAGAIRPEDPEFEAQVRSRIGPQYREVVDRNRAARIDSAGPLNYLGLHLSNPDEKASFVADNGYLFGPSDIRQLLDPEKRVYGFDNASNPQTYAHEFRHAAGVEDELTNRIQDLIFSASEPQYEANVRMMFEGLYRQGLAPHPEEVSFADKEDTVLNYVSKNTGIEDQIDSGSKSPLELLDQYPFLHFANRGLDPRNPGSAPERRGTPGYAGGGRAKKRGPSLADWAAGLGAGAQGAGYVYDAMNTVPVLSYAGTAADATSAAGSVMPTAADLGVAADPSLLSSGLGVLGVFNTAMNILGGGTVQGWIHGPDHSIPYEQVQALEQILPTLLGDRVKFVDNPFPNQSGQQVMTVDGNILNNEQLWRLATGRTIFANSENPIRIDWNTGELAAGPKTYNNEGVIGQPGIWDIINSGGTANPGDPQGNYDDYPNTGGATGGSPGVVDPTAPGGVDPTGGTPTSTVPTGSGSWDEILAGAGGAGVFGQIWDWVKDKYPEMANGEGALGSFTDWFGDLPWYIKAGLGAGVLGAIGDSATPNEYNPNPPPKFPGQPETLAVGAPRTPLAPNIDYYTYGQRPGVAFFSNVNVPTQPERVESMPATENGNNPAKPNWLPGVPAYKARGGALSNSYFSGSDSGRADTIEARLSPGEYVIDAETVSLLGDGNNEAGAKKLDAMRSNVRKHKGRALAQGKFSANARDPEHYLRARK